MPRGTEAAPRLCPVIPGRYRHVDAKPNTICPTCHGRCRTVSHVAGFRAGQVRTVLVIDPCRCCHDRGYLVGFTAPV
ncbi:hypothetical protein ThrDRAFT_02712 [Frankia casuarinae]|nr:hypothetical protein CcI6DRAFT_03386 [Frankia sp. CcI6]EYT91589.1 hypothetical protein ThrDRAFT_02712 [Frankia casuarinae]KDA40870.1 hypothetical protein BMG523Draft_04311 [Frankia sp. BMG5.23]KEZ34959.1 hypothetical protein CEDDRAFT_03704 [Frankia sp. CeD]KFB03744.1 hypothetical protein ALLO2DRAFT_03549 [Frankia sp. Allo2]